MTIRAYSELYLNDAVKNLANAFDYAINVCGQNADWFAKLFVQSEFAGQFERGNPAVVAGKSGEEMARDILHSVYPDKKFPDPVFSEDRSPEYWAGRVLAHYQWESTKRFRDIFSRIPLTEIVSMCRTFREMDIVRFCESIERRYNETDADTNLRRIRENRGFSPSELSIATGVSIRSIQMYEQKVHDIDKAQAQNLYKLAVVLGCSIEDLLESPGMS